MFLISQGDKTYEELTKLLTRELEPTKLPIAARYEFCQLKQGSDDVATYVRKLRAAAEECDFKSTLDERLRDQLVFGLKNKDAVQKLLTEDISKLGLDRATKIATANEAVHRSQIRMSSDVSDISFVSRRKKTLPTATLRSQGQDKCTCCGKSNHVKSTCRFRNCKCHVCGTIGHLKAVCRRRFRKESSSFKVQAVECTKNEDNEIFSIGRGRFYKNVVINGYSLQMIFDTGSDVSIINEDTYLALGGKSTLKLDEGCRRLKAYGDNDIKVLGEAMVDVADDGDQQQLPVIVTRGAFPCIYGLDWIRAFQPNFLVNTVTDLKVSLALKEGTSPVFVRPRSLDYGRRAAVKEELDRLVTEGVLVKVEQSDWATPIVPVAKPDGRVRLCGDYKVTLNPCLRDMMSTTPPLEDIINSMQGSSWFTELDLKDAYHQLPMDEESSMLTTLSTPFGLYRHVNLPFGVKTSPAIFQNVMEKLLINLPGVQIYQDNIYVHASSRSSHDERLATVIQRLKEHNFSLNEKKCRFNQRQINVLGTMINGKEAWPNPEKTEIIRSLKPPTSSKEVKSFLGLIEFYGRFIPQLSSLKEPLTRLTRKNQPFVWLKQQQQAFQKLKSVLCKDVTLSLFDPCEKVVLRCDASPVGIGAVLEQQQRPVLFVSKTLSTAERNYAQIEREALAIIWAVKRLHKYHGTRTKRFHVGGKLEQTARRFHICGKLQQTSR